jgi:hypothetical protein
VFLEIVRDRTQGRVHRSARLVKGSRDDWYTQRSVMRLGISIYETGRACLVWGRRHTAIPLPRLRMWLWLYRKLHQA